VALPLLSKGKAEMVEMLQAGVISEVKQPTDGVLAWCWCLNVIPKFDYA